MTTPSNADYLALSQAAYTTGGASPTAPTGWTVISSAPENSDGMQAVAFQKEILTKREIEILTWSARGKTYAEISLMLSITKETVRTYVKRAGTKLDTTNKIHTVIVAYMRGFIKL